MCTALFSVWLGNFEKKLLESVQIRRQVRAPRDSKHPNISPSILELVCKRVSRIGDVKCDLTCFGHMNQCACWIAIVCEVHVSNRQSPVSQCACGKARESAWLLASQLALGTEFVVAYLSMTSTNHIGSL